MPADSELYLPCDPDEWQQARGLRCIARFSPVLPLGTFLGASTLVVYLWPVAGGGRLAAYLGLALVLCAILLVGSRVVARRRTGVLAHDLALSRRWLLGASLGVGAFWAVTTLAVLPVDSAPHQVAVAFILAAVTALWLPLFAIDRTTLLTLAAPVLLPLAFALLSSPTADPPITMGSALLLLFAAIVAAARFIERMFEADGASQRALHHDATHDGLVGLVNHAQFHRCVGRLDGARRGPCAIVFVDLDHFKEVNDVAGHGAGDRVLKEVGEILRQEKRKMDIAARVGGDEFALLMEFCTAHEALRVADAVRRRIAELDIEHAARTVDVTASIGIACTTSHLVSARAVLEAADRACYAAKRAGRNRVEFAIDDDFEVDDTADGSRPPRSSSSRSVTPPRSRPRRPGLTARVGAEVIG